MFQKLDVYGINEVVCDTAVVSSVKTVNCSNGTTAYFLSCFTPDATFVAKVWDEGAVDVSEGVQSLKGKAVQISGKITSYKDVKEISVLSVRLAEGADADISKYLKSVDYEGLSKEYISLLKKHLSQNAFKVVGIFMSDDRGVSFEKFIKWVAAVGYHDNLIGGLVNHTTKMLRIAEVLISGDKRLEKWKDLIFMGVAIHDIGKLLEYTGDGQMSKYWYVGHKAFGIELLSANKAEIVSLVGEEFYYQLMAVLDGHHGAFGEPCHTVATCVVHYIDMLDSAVTHLVQEVEKATDKTIRIDDAFVDISVPALLSL